MTKQSIPPRRICLGAAAICLLTAVTACAPPDTPAELVPSALIELARPDTLRSMRVTEGVRYHYLWSGQGPWAIHLIRADLTRCDLRLAVLTASPSEPPVSARATVSEMVGREDGTHLVAVNGDFFTPEGLPLGSEVSRGAVRRARDRPAVAWEPARDPWIGLVRADPDGLHAGRWIGRSGNRSEIEVVSGFPELLDGGRRVAEEATGGSSFATTRHPRTALAFAPREDAFWLVVVDGRQGAYSAGMTLAELTDLFVALGATEALNLDGGGSSVMVVGGRAVSRPSDAGGERPVANALALRRDPASCTRRPGG